MRAYEYHHVVGFEETNLLGNVYYVNHLSWQGRCRELFLRDHAPGLLDDISRGLRLVTVRCACEYDHELLPFDRVVVRMTLGELKPHGMTLRFAYVKVDGTRETLVARGEQEIACLRGANPVAVPAELRDALRPYAGGPAGA
jgi:enediyne biosynthesis thioesterase